MLKLTTSVDFVLSLNLMPQNSNSVNNIYHQDILEKKELSPPKFCGNELLGNLTCETALLSVVVSHLTPKLEQSDLGKDPQNTTV